MWEVDGKPQEKVDLLKGYLPRSFYPYESYIKVVRPDTLSVTRNTPITFETGVQDRQTKQVVTSQEITLRVGEKGELPFAALLSFTSKIRFVALEGIEEERDYPHQLGLVDNLLVGEVEGEERFDAPTQYRYRTKAKLALIKKPKKKWWHFW